MPALGLPLPEERGLSADQAPCPPYALAPRRTRIQDLHGPHDEAGPLWPSPEKATERWEYGQLRSVQSATRLDELRERFGPARVEGASIEARPGGALDGGEARSTHAWPGMLQRAFDHVAAKAAHLGALEPEALSPYGAIGLALWRGRARPRAETLRGLLEQWPGESATLYRELDAVDRSLDARAGEAPWIFDQVPDHCLRLWPLRNVMRMAERQGVLFRRMSFSAYEAEDSFVPDLAVACLDSDIYGGGFDHDLFHHLLPVSPPSPSLDFETSMLVVESAAQAYNSLVLASRYDGPNYDGHAPWPGAALFERLSGIFGRATLPELIGAYGRLGLVSHPELRDSSEDLWTSLVGRCDLRAAEALSDEHARYVRLDAGWLRTLRPRYESELMSRWRDALGERLAPSAQDVVSALDDLLWSLEDIDLRTHDSSLIGEASSLRQRARWLWMRALELEHLSTREGLSLLPELLESLSALSEHFKEMDTHVRACTRQTTLAPRERERSATEALEHLTQRFEARSEALAARLEGVAQRLRARQREGSLGGPPLPEPFVDTHRELFAGHDYELPQHVGADGPGAPP